MAIEIRPLRWGDFDGWVELQTRRYDELESDPELGLYTYPTRPTAADLTGFFAGLHAGILEGRMLCHVAEEDGRILGHASVFPKGEYREVRHVGSLGMAVHPEHRGRGIGDRLLSRTLSESVGRFEWIELTVTSTNVIAQRLYRTHGFEERGRLPRSFKRGTLYLDEILMSRPVGGPPAR